MYVVVHNVVNIVADIVVVVLVHVVVDVDVYLDEYVYVLVYTFWDVAVNCYVVDYLDFYVVVGVFVVDVYVTAGYRSSGEEGQEQPDLHRGHGRRNLHNQVHHMS